MILKVTNRDPSAALSLDCLHQGDRCFWVTSEPSVLEAGQFCRVIPRIFLYSIQLGMQRNELQDNLHNLSSMYSGQARQGQSRLQSVLLPAMVILVGGVVALAVLAVFLPMIQVITSLSSAG